ncbi:MAG TPA: hypothetical protein VLS89_14695 [Candidatus Nanopelagicales bacterium]|nr:hypothetical protein [Candidatus Nanopelagicales bacterium]
MRRLLLVALVAVAPSALACKALEPPPPPPQVITVRVESDPGRPLGGADLIYNGQTVSQTGPDGVGKLKLGGRDGELFDIRVVCPQGYASPERPIQVMLRRLADPSKSPEYSATCPPSTRSVVVAVRAEGGADLPVTYLGREVARTDESGAAHVLLKLQPGEQFELMIDTREREAELSPRSPMQSFAVGQRNDVFTFDQKFERSAPARPTRYYGPAKPKGPVKIN